MTDPTLIIYTTETGGIMTCFWASREEFDRLVEAREINETPHLDYETIKPLKMVAFATVHELRDFVGEAIKSIHRPGAGT